MRRPTMQALPPALAESARAVARSLGAAGHRAWLVGGAVRDLALAVEPGDVDLASDARPEEVERLFSVAHAVGRAFGTVVVRAAGLDVQVTTFRAESGYADARRPREVRFGATLEEDAARRDFTCNALYLDPLNDALADPTGGLDDLAARRLCCVGAPSARFAEDGLRLLRLARLAAEHALEVEPATWAGAAGALDALRGLSPERILAELTRMAEGRDPARATRLAHELGVLARLPGCAALGARTLGLDARVAAVGRLPAGGVAAYFATLFHPGPAEASAPSLAALTELRPSRALLTRVAGIHALAPELAACRADLVAGRERRARWVRLVRAPEFEEALAVERAWLGDEGERERSILGARGRLGREALWPAPLVTSAELARAGIARGPRWAELLRAAEDAQIEGELTTLGEARAWLAARARDA